MNEKELTRKVASTFESLEIPYFITGSIASIAQGEARYTNDIDVVADISASAVPALLNAYPDSEFYVSESAILDAISRRFQFNIIHPTSGLKVDVMIPKDNEYNKIRMQRKVRLNIDAQKMAWFSSAEDVILMKLVFFQLGGSDKHLRDIAGVFLVQKDKIDQDYLNQWSEKLGVADELQLVRDRLQEEQEN